MVTRAKLADNPAPSSVNVGRLPRSINGRPLSLWYRAAGRSRRLTRNWGCAIRCCGAGWRSCGRGRRRRRADPRRKRRRCRRGRLLRSLGCARRTNHHRQYESRAEAQRDILAFMLLQSNPTPFRLRIYRPDQDGPKTSLILSTFLGEDHSEYPKDLMIGKATVAAATPQTATKIRMIRRRRF